MSLKYSKVNIYSCSSCPTSGAHSFKIQIPVGFIGHAMAHRLAWIHSRPEVFLWPGIYVPVHRISCDLHCTFDFIHTASGTVLPELLYLTLWPSFENCVDA